MNIARDDVVLFEVGAYDGLTYSNTFALESFNACKCVLIEPSPVNVRKIYANRQLASVHRLAVMSNSGVCEFLGDEPISGVRRQLTDQYIEAWNLDQASRYNVLALPLKIITNIERVEYIDFLSIDVQGSELSVLRSVDWAIPVGVICVELEGQNVDDDEACRGILRNLGYHLKSRLHISEFWYRPDYFRSNLLFDPKKRVHGLDTFEHLYFTEGWQSALRSKFY
jgi:FkbM family methyltransferase